MIPIDFVQQILPEEVIWVALYKIKRPRLFWRLVKKRDNSQRKALSNKSGITCEIDSWCLTWNHEYENNLQWRFGALCVQLGITYDKVPHLYHRTHNAHARTLALTTTYGGIQTSNSPDEELSTEDKGRMVTRWICLIIQLYRGSLLFTFFNYIINMCCLFVQTNNTYL